MEDSIKSIGERLKGLRDSLDVSAEEIAELCEISLEHYLKIEDGEADPSVYRLSKIAKRYGISLDVLLFGEEPRMNSYYLTRKGMGQSVERGNLYQYQSLASGFVGRKADPFLVQVDPDNGIKPYRANTHSGQEFDFVLEGQLELTYGDKVHVLNEGDSIYFDTTVPHRMRALGGRSVRFLCILV